MCAVNGKKLYIIKPRCSEPARTQRLDTVLADALSVPEEKDFSVVHVGCAEEMPQELCGAVLFVISLGVSGVNLEYYALLKYIRLHPHLFAMELPVLATREPDYFGNCGWQRDYGKAITQDTARERSSREDV